ncbi:MAG: hypothetical protein HGA29_06910 [Syntrophaceae bacterium]|nr:hypothetical protein [Syntrophaceae bacterium]
MRFSAEILLNSDRPIIPSDYHRNILSLLKEAIKTNQNGTEIHEKHFIKDERKIKPFTFAVSFKADQIQNVKGTIRLVEPWLNLHFSASDPVLFKYVYDGLLQLQKDYPLFPELKSKIGPLYCPECLLLRCDGCKIKVTIGQVNLEPKKIIREGEMLFRTCSPAIVPDNDESGGPSGCVTPDSPVFEDKLYSCVKSMCQVLLDNEPELARKDFAAEFTDFEKVHISHYTNQGRSWSGEKELIEATAGIIRIKAPMPVLQLIYNAGLGSKCSEGFGMLEIID